MTGRYKGTGASRFHDWSESEGCVSWAICPPGGGYPSQLRLVLDRNEQSGFRLPAPNGWHRSVGIRHIMLPNWRRVRSSRQQHSVSSGQFQRPLTRRNQTLGASLSATSCRSFSQLISMRPACMSGAGTRTVAVGDLPGSRPNYASRLLKSDIRKAAGDLDQCDHPDNERPRRVRRGRGGPPATPLIK